ASEIAFCGAGTAIMTSQLSDLKQGEYPLSTKHHELSILDLPAYLGGQLSKQTCKLTHLATDGDRDRNRELRDWLNGEGNSVKFFIAQENDRVKKEFPMWCQKYGVTPENGRCVGLEIDYDNCAETQKFWSQTDRENYGIGKPIKYRDGAEIPNELGIFEYP